MRTATAALLPLLLSLVWLALPGKVLAPPANYTDGQSWRTTSRACSTSVRIRQATTLPPFATSTRSTSTTGRFGPTRTNIASFYGAVEIARAQSAENDLRRGLTNNPASALLRGLLLDVYYAPRRGPVAGRREPAGYGGKNEAGATVRSYRAGDR